MSQFVLPTKLKKEPLIEAVFELRFSTLVPAASNVLTGLLFSRLGTPTQIERLPISDIPSQMRSSDPALKFQPLLKLTTDRFTIMVGDWSVTIACQLPYPGWGLFKPKIIDTVNILKDINIIEYIERYSMRYVDIIESDDIASQIKRTNIGLTIGTHKLYDEPVTVRIEIAREALIHILQIAAPASIVVTGITRTGIVVDVDSVCNHKTSELDNFTHELHDRLDTIHKSNKTMFFECLTKETIDYLEPVYDTTST